VGSIRREYLNEFPVLALSGHGRRVGQCPLLEEKRTWNPRSRGVSVRKDPIPAGTDGAGLEYGRGGYFGKISLLRL
jgi:hypothetical protein